MSKDKVRQFDTGATRSQDASRIDPEAMLSPIVIERYCEYLNKHRAQPDGYTRDPDNWQKGIPLSVYVKGLWRHMLHLWTRHRGFTVNDPGAAENIEEDLCAVIFNAQGYLFELLKEKRKIAVLTSMEERWIDACANITSSLGLDDDFSAYLRQEYATDNSTTPGWSKTPPAQTGWYRFTSNKGMEVGDFSGKPISAAYYEAHKCICVLLAGKPIPVSEIGGWWLGPFDTYAEAEKAG